MIVRGIAHRAELDSTFGPRVPRMLYLVIATFILIFISLGCALYFLIHDRGQSTRTLKALAIRVALSVGLFIFLMASYRFGWIHGHLLS